MQKSLEPGHARASIRQWFRRTMLISCCVGLLHESALAGSTSGTRFEEVAERSGLIHRGEEFTSIAWVDYNGDGRQDLFLGNHSMNSSDDLSRLFLSHPPNGFIDVWNDLQLSSYRTDAHGANWVDFDGDGDQDLMITAGGKQGRADQGDNNLLFIQQGGRLREMAEINNIHRTKARGRFSAWFDLDHDGRLDIMQVNVPRPDQVGKNVAARNYPDNYFIRFDREEVRWPTVYGGHQLVTAGLSDRHRSALAGTEVMGLSRMRRGVTAGDDLPEVFWSGRYLVATADFNGDLRTDFLLYEPPPTPPGTCRIPSSSDNSLGIAVSAPGLRQQPAAIDLRLEGSARLSIRRKNVGVSLYQGADSVPRSLGSIELSPDDRTLDGIPASLPAGSGLHVGRTGDGNWRLTAYGDWPKNFLLWLRPADPHTQVSSSLPRCAATSNAPMRLLLQTDSGFRDASGHWNLPRKRACGTAIPGDFDNDGDVDIYLACASRVHDLRDLVLWNDDNTGFSRATVRASRSTSHPGFFDFSLVPWRQAVAADYDNDGFLDVAISPGVLFDDRQHLTGSPLQLLHNLGNGNHWLQLQLVGTRSNRDGIGSRVEVVTGDRTQLREADGGFNNYGQHAKRLHFGLGDSDRVDVVRITWDSGQVQELYDLPVNRIVTVQEP